MGLIGLTEKRSKDDWGMASKSLRTHFASSRSRRYCIIQSYPQHRCHCYLLLSAFPFERVACFTHRDSTIASFFFLFFILSFYFLAFNASALSICLRLFCSRPIEFSLIPYPSNVSPFSFIKYHYKFLVWLALVWFGSSAYNAFIDLVTWKGEWFQSFVVSFFRHNH